MGHPFRYYGPADKTDLIHQIFLGMYKDSLICRRDRGIDYFSGVFLKYYTKRATANLGWIHEVVKSEVRCIIQSLLLVLRASNSTQTHFSKEEST